MHRLLTPIVLAILASNAFADVNFTFTGVIPDGASTHSMIEEGESFLARFRIDTSVIPDLDVFPNAAIYEQSVRFGFLEFSGGFKSPNDFAGIDSDVQNDAVDTRFCNPNVRDDCFADTVGVQIPGQSFSVGVFSLDTSVIDSLDIPEPGTSIVGNPNPYTGPYPTLQLIYNDSLGRIFYLAGDANNTAFASTGVGDVNFDNEYDCADVDAIVSEIANGGDEMFLDLTNDGTVDLDDLDAWRIEAGEANLGLGKAYLPGDANLDGFVDTSDFNVWNDNKFTNTAAWCSGDFNADGFVDTSDFNIWNDNKFTSSDISTVPEPSALGLTLVAAILGGVFFRRE